MKIKASSIIWGLTFILVGFLLLGRSLWGWDMSIWGLFWKLWPLFIIVPSVSTMLTRGFNMGSFIWLMIGVIALLLTNGLLSGDQIRRLMVPAVFVLIGLGMLIKGVLGGPTGNKKYIENDNYSKNNNYSNNSGYSYANNGYTNNNSNVNNTNNATADNTYEYEYDSSSEQTNRNFKFDSTSQKKPEYNAMFSAQHIKFPNEVFTGTCINAVFGSVVLDLREAIIVEDVVINASAIFAGADIYVPSNVNVKTSSIPIFGGVSNKAGGGMIAGPTLYINATCMFGGVDIK